MSDILNKLAMEVSEWLASGFYKAGMRNEDYEILNDYQMKRDWEQRRKELINEPDDSDAPEWANWKAQDSCGKWFWYEEKPIAGECMWTDEDGEWQGSNNGKIPAGRDWRTTLKEVNQMDNLKEVKLAWANDETVQYLCHTDDAWKDWGSSQSLNTKWYNVWRVKPKTRTHTQWERKFYCPDTTVVLTAFNTLSDQFPSNARWVSEPVLRTYEIEE